MAQVKVTFQPGGQAIQVPRGTAISEAACAAGVNLITPCGGKGLCGQCQVTIESGRVAEPTEAERRHLSPEQLTEGMRLACQATVVADVVVEVEVSEERSLVEVDVVVVVEVGVGVGMLSHNTTPSWLKLSDSKEPTQTQNPNCP